MDYQGFTKVFDTMPLATPSTSLDSTNLWPPLPSTTLRQEGHLDHGKVINEKERSR